MLFPVRFIEAPDGRTISRRIGCGIEVPLAGKGIIQAGAEGTDHAEEQHHLTGGRGVIADFPAIPAGLKHDV
jgi:hypothetical protein